MSELKKPKASEMCQPGCHGVRGHERVCHSGTVTWVMVKALISVESSFNPNAKSKDPKSTASGLMQVTDQSLRVLGGFSNKEKWIEMRNHLIHVTKADKLDPVVSVALGTRLLAHKFSQAPKKYAKNAKSALIGYHQWNKKGEAYADEVLSRYEKARKKK